MTHSEDGAPLPPRRAPRLPDPGWLPDPSRIDLERFWNGTRWTGHTRDIAPTIERIPAAESRPAHDRRSQPPREKSRSGGGGVVALLLAVVVAIAGAGYVGALPSWAPWPTELTRGMPAGPDVAYPVFGSDETVTYLARSLIAQKAQIDVTWIQASGLDARS
ncbi:MAG: DUF2510 domain-containing protein, partial [Demequinaceae bacterium]|nr:DUF2510 domain-containing protein [Demequinaceae bacterium]